MSEYTLHSPWNLWYHGLEDKSWTKQSYKHIFTINNLYDLEGFHEIINQRHLQNSMFFLMRDDIFPTWEDPDNREGCCVSYKVPSNQLKEQWSKMVDRVVTEDILCNLAKHEELNGISIAPKKEFNIIKLWLRNTYDSDTYTDLIKQYEPIFVKEKSIVKAHELSY